MTHEEQTINALPEAARQKMARYCLEGWVFTFYKTGAVNFWCSKGQRWHLGATLPRLLNTMEMEDAWKNAAARERAERISAKHL